jgi:hypothetical protein
MVHTVDVPNRACIRSFVVELVAVIVELVPGDLIHPPDPASLKLMVTSTLQLRRPEVMVVVEELWHMYMPDSGREIGRYTGSIPRRKPWLVVGEMDMVEIAALLDVCLRGRDWRGSWPRCRLQIVEQSMDGWMVACVGWYGGVKAYRW